MKRLKKLGSTYRVKTGEGKGSNTEPTPDQKEYFLDKFGSTGPAPGKMNNKRELGYFEIWR